MRILLVTQYYPPEPVLKFADLARGLRRRGHDVQVLTGFPCYPSSKTYAGYRQRLYCEREIDGVLVTRLPQLPNHSRSIIGRALYYLSFALSAATIGLWRMRRADVILAYQSALPTALAAWFMSRVRRTPYVLDIADLWPESVAASGMLKNSFALSAIEACMKFAYRGAARIIVITEGYRDRLLALGVPRRKLELIHYWVPSGQFDPVACEEQIAQDDGLTGRFNVMYSGTMGPVQDLSAVIDAAALVADELPSVQFVMVGDGLESETLTARAKQLGLTNVRFLGRKTPAEVRRLSQAADVLLVHLKPDDLSRISIPSKTFACMASGRPILMAVEGESSRLVATHGCGIVAEPSNASSLADAVRRLVAMPASERQRMAEAGLKAYRENYSSEVQIPKVERLLTDMTSAVARRPTQPDATNSSPRGVYLRGGKRLLDVLVAGSLFVLLLPLMALIALVVRWRLGSPVLFTQVRPGRGGRLFKLHKFRTMRAARDETGRELPDAERLTGFGRVLRATSLDELPELWNVLRGAMSLVGPRPLLPEYLRLYSERQMRRHELRPGITGWAQVNGRNALSWEERFERDIWYVDNCRFWLDVKILLITVWQFVRPRGISTPGHATAERFVGITSPCERAAAIPPTRDKSVIVIGAGGHATVVISTLRAAGWHVEAAYDDDPAKHGQQILGVEIRGPIAAIEPHRDTNAVIAIGDGKLRRSIASLLELNWISVTHPAAWVDSSVKLGPGTVVFAGAVVQPGARVGRHAIINTLAGVDHDCRIGDFAHVGPGAHLAGSVHVVAGALVGAGATAIPGVRVGEDAIIGAGATVVDDVPDRAVAVGCPARVIRQISANATEMVCFQQAR